MKMLLTSFQWMVFMIASSIVAPIAIAGLFGFNAAETASFMQRTMFILGLAGVLQALWGHRLPINEGPAGLWWGVFAIYAGFAGTVYASGSEVLRSLEGGLMVSGLLFILFAALGLVEKLMRLFTPTVTFLYLLLLILQLSGSFMKGMLGLPNDSGLIQLPVALGSLLTLVVAFYLSAHKNIFIRQYSVILSLAFGWGVFAFLGLAPSIPESPQLVKLPEIFAFGSPIFDPGIIVTAAFTTLLLITNMVASIRVMEEVQTQFSSAAKKGSYRSTGMVAGINQMASGLFSAVGPVPIAGAAGFVAQTKSAAVRPFLAGSSLVILASLLPPVINRLSALPAAVGYAVTFVIFTQMAGLAFAELDKVKEKEQSRLVSGVALLAGVGAMFVPVDSFRELPAAVTSIVSNGLILGTLTAIAVEQFLIRKGKRNQQKEILKEELSVKKG